MTIAYIVLLIMGLYTGASGFFLDKYGSSLFEEKSEEIPKDVEIIIKK